MARNKWLDALKPSIADAVLEELFNGSKLGAVRVLRNEVDLVTAKSLIDHIVDAEPYLLGTKAN